MARSSLKQAQWIGSWENRNYHSITFRCRLCTHGFWQIFLVSSAKSRARRGTCLALFHCHWPTFGRLRLVFWRSWFHDFCLLLVLLAVCLLAWSRPLWSRLGEFRESHLVESRIVDVHYDRKPVQYISLGTILSFLCPRLCHCWQGKASCTLNFFLMISANPWRFAFLWSPSLIRLS